VLYNIGIIDKETNMKLLLTRLLVVAILVTALLSIAQPVVASRRSSPIVSAASAAPPTQIDPGEQFRIRFTRLHCHNANEDDFWSDGDEPYVIFAILAPDPWAGYTLSFQASRVFSSVDTHDTIETNLILMDKHVDRSVVVIAQVIDEDDTGKSALLVAAEEEASVQFVRALARGERDLNQLRDIVAAYMSRGMAFASNSSGDDDELIGRPTPITFRTGELDNLRVNDSISKDSEVRGEGARYTITIEAARTQ